MNNNERVHITLRRKSKESFTTEDADAVIVDYKDDATAFNGLKRYDSRKRQHE